MSENLPFRQPQYCDITNQASNLLKTSHQLILAAMNKYSNHLNWLLLDVEEHRLYTESLQVTL